MKAVKPFGGSWDYTCVDKDDSMTISDNNLIWLDMEMTGLDPFTDHILEVATVITSQDLEILAIGPNIAVYHPEEVLGAMDEWNTTQHGKSGLLDRVRLSTHAYRDAEAETLAFLRGWVSERKSPLCGNSIGHDRRFLARLMPELESFFHYRNLDVSTLKELARRWAPEIVDSFTKTNNHMALEDIKESIAELQHYSDHFICR